MSTATQPALETRHFKTTEWASWTIFAVDVLALESAFILGLTFRRMLAIWFTASIGVDQYFGVAIALLVLPLIHYQLGLYPGYLLGPVERLRRRTLATFAVFGGLVAWDNIVERGVLSRGVLLATFVFALVLPPLAESLARTALIKTRRWGLPVVMLGAGETGRAVARTLAREPNLGLVPIAFLDQRPSSWNTVLEDVPVVGPLALVRDFEGRAEAAIVTLNDLKSDNSVAILHELNFPRIIVIPDLAGMASLWVTARDLGGCLGLELKKNLLIRVAALTDHRNDAGHKPKNRAALIARDRELRTRFEHAVDVLRDFANATRPLRLHR